MDHNPVQRGMPVRSPVTRVRRMVPLVRPVRHLPQILGHDDVNRLVGALRKDRDWDRDRAMVDAMLLDGLRHYEVLGLRLQDIRWGEKRLFIANSKGGHQRIVPISPPFFTTPRSYRYVSICLCTSTNCSGQCDHRPVCTRPRTLRRPSHVLGYVLGGAKRTDGAYVSGY